MDNKSINFIDGIGSAGSSKRVSGMWHFYKRKTDDKKILFTIKELKDEKENNDEN
jgi:hypothetical protein